MSKFYLPLGDEIEIFRSAFEQKLPLLLKGPTGCGKTRFVEYMSEQLRVPLISVACHEDLSAADLVGRYLLKGGDTIWVDGPLTKAIKQGAICYLDEVVEARADTTVVIHPLADYRRELHIERLGESIIAPPSFMLVLSYNPGYQSVLKDLKPSTRQRLVSVELEYPEAELERKILMSETGLHQDLAQELVKLANAIRTLEMATIAEVASTRTLVNAAKLIVGGLHIKSAVWAAIITPLSDDRETTQSLGELVEAYLG